MIITGDQQNLTRPSEELSIAVTFPRDQGATGPVSAKRQGVDLNSDEKIPTTQIMEIGDAVLRENGFSITGRGKATMSARCNRKQFEMLFQTNLSKMSIGQPPGTMVSADHFFFPGDDASWDESSQLYHVIDDAYIQWPHIYMNQRFSRTEPSPIPSTLQVGYYHLSVPDVSVLLNVERAHRAQMTGQGVRVAMIDTGFAHGHPYFKERGYNTATHLAGIATDVDQDGDGHGTGESANLLEVAPDVEFIGIKLGNEKDSSAGASILEGIHEALRHDPAIISISMGYDLRDGAGNPLQALPNNLVALEVEIQAAVSSGVVVVFSAGNGHIGFPGMMPEVISAGGVFVDTFGRMEASDYASAFDSQIYNGRHVPDCSGLVGRASNRASYVSLPIPLGCTIDVNRAMLDGTQPNDGWGVFSGTSAAAPQIAGACSLLLQKNPGLSPSEIKNALIGSARPVAYGHASPASNPGEAPLQGQSATGGLVDVFEALQLV